MEYWELLSDRTWAIVRERQGPEAVARERQGPGAVAKETDCALTLLLCGIHSAEVADSRWLTYCPSLSPVVNGSTHNREINTI